MVGGEGVQRLLIVYSFVPTSTRHEAKCTVNTPLTFANYLVDHREFVCSLSSHEQKQTKAVHVPLLELAQQIKKGLKRCQFLCSAQSSAPGEEETLLPKPG